MSLDRAAEAVLGELGPAGARSPDSLALGVADGSVRFSYGQLDRLVGDLCQRLTADRAAPPRRLALYSDNRPEFVVALLAAWALGAAVVPVDPQLTAGEIGTRLRDVEADVVLVPEQLRDRYAPAAPVPHWVIGVRPDGSGVDVSQLPGGGGPEERDAQPAGAALPPGTALLLYTTGSTGKPKIVPLTHANLAASVSDIRSGYDLSAQDATVVVMPMFHGHGLIAGLLATLAGGGAAWLPTTGRFSAHRFWSEMARSGATWFTAVPTVHQILLARADTDRPPEGTPALRFIRSCSAPLASAVLHRMEERFGAPVVVAYGMTETAHQATTNPLPGKGARTEGSVGVPAGLQVRIVTSGVRPSAAGEVGEVCVRGPAVTPGYLADPQASAAAFVDGWFHTGDLGHLDAAGHLFIDGRSKEMINRGGEKIAPYAIEEVLLGHPAVQDALAFPVPDQEYGEDVNAAVVLRPGMAATEAELQQRCRDHLAAFEVPSRILLLDRFPRTAKGDGDRRALAAAVAGG